MKVPTDFESSSLTTDNNDNTGVEFHYDALNLTKESNALFGTTYNVTSAYNNVNLRTDLDYPGGKSLDLSYDSYYNLTRVYDGAAELAKRGHR